LMATRAHGSEEAMARLACRRLRDRGDARVLIGGLGMGYTLRAALNVLRASAQVLVVELVPEVVVWNRAELGAVAGFPLLDRRVVVQVGDVSDVLHEAKVPFDAILLDIDNGPQAPVRVGNAALFAPAGLQLIRQALRGGGMLAVWSADPCAAFMQSMRDAGYRARSVEVRARGREGDPMHTIFLGVSVADCVRPTPQPAASPLPRRATIPRCRGTPRRPSVGQGHHW
ncbi:MAG TPA: hypothetical protein VLI93_02030, partial [Acetobacteraceae bacterium]|nr:hypothetical protein [Acetobacteraceae bacterium]